MKTLFFAVPVLLLASAALQAQQFEVSASAGIPRHSTKSLLGAVSEADPIDTDTRLKGLQSGTVRFTWNTPGYYGHELGYTLQTADFRTIIRTTENNATVERPASDKVNIHKGHYNFLIYFMPSGERWRPYITGGLQMYYYMPPGIPEYTFGRHRTYGGNYGGGIKLAMHKNVLLRLDVRDYVGGKPFTMFFKDPANDGGIFRTLEASVGFSIAWGGKRD